MKIGIQVPVCKSLGTPQVPRVQNPSVPCKKWAMTHDRPSSRTPEAIIWAVTKFEVIVLFDVHEFPGPDCDADQARGARGVN